MIYDLTRLYNNIDKFVEVNNIYSFSKEEMSGTDLISLDDVKVTGELTKNSLDNVELNAKVEGVMVLPCAITLKPVNYPFNIEICGELGELFSENSTNFKNTIDILPIIWENILMEIPMRVVCEEAKNSNIELKGDGWSFTTGEEEKVSPLSELMDYLDDSEVK